MTNKQKYRSIYYLAIFFFLISLFMIVGSGWVEIGAYALLSLGWTLFAYAYKKQKETIE